MDDNTPVIIGVGQYSERVGEPGYSEMSHMDLGGAALKAAFADAQAAQDLGPALDTLAAIRQFEISATRYSAPFGHANNTPRAIASRAGANPARAILEVVGGQGPQRLVGELAAETCRGPVKDGRGGRLRSDFDHARADVARRKARLVRTARRQS